MPVDSSHRWRRPLHTGLVSLLSSCVLAAVAHGQPTPARASSPSSTASATTTPANVSVDSPQYHRLKTSFDALADPDPVVRENARQRLMGMSPADLPLLKHLVDASRPLQPAQAAALHDIVFQVYLGGDAYPSNPEQAFLGVGMGMPVFSPGEVEGPAGVVVQSRFPGFPGYQFLRDGDLIVGVQLDGALQRINTSAELSTLIASRRGGDTLELEIHRGGRALKIPVKLAPMPQAATTAPGAAARFENFQRERIQRAQAYWLQSFAPAISQDKP